MRSVVVLSLMSGCFGGTRSRCEITTTEVADDEVTDQGSAEGLLSRIGGVRELDGALDDGTPVTVTLTVERGRGTAVHTDGTMVGGTGGFGFGRSYEMIAIPCPSLLQVPVDVAVVTDDASFDVGIAGSATTFDAENLIETAIFGEVPLDESGLADPPQLAAEDEPTAMAFVTVTYSTDGTSTGGAGWEPQPAAGDYVDDSAVFLVSWP